MTASRAMMAPMTLAALLLLSFLPVDGFAGEGFVLKSDLSRHKGSRWTDSKTTLQPVSLFRELPGFDRPATTCPAPPPYKHSSTALEQSTIAQDVNAVPFGRSETFGDRCRSLVRHGLPQVKSLVTTVLRETWWTAPMSLGIWSGYSFFVRKIPVRMPNWWALTNISHLVDRKSILGVFLGSNVAFLLSGAYLLRWKAPSSMQRQKRDKLLGSCVIIAGLVSYIFHHFQAYGTPDVAHLFCYFDHAVAITTILCGVYSCGRPGLPTCILSALGFVTLTLTGPGYAWLHSAWHCISALAACTWVHDSERRAATHRDEQMVL